MNITAREYFAGIALKHYLERCRLNNPTDEELYEIIERSDRVGSWMAAQIAEVRPEFAAKYHGYLDEEGTCDPDSDSLP